jgi:predicted protein tyrosine phosphatase
MFLRGVPAPKVSAVLSIHGHREFGVEAQVGHRLDLGFDDVEAAIPGDLTSLQAEMRRKRCAEENGLVEVAPVAADVTSIVRFANEVREVDGIVLVHCGGGMSRAPAAALVCLAVWRGPGAESQCVEEILRLRRGAVPQLGLVRLADQLLARDGRLASALAQSRH